jgi:4-amino-4-deoxy-L-arabinose transferase-like glycosyltransferase
MQDIKRAQRTFLLLWTVVTAIKLLIAARLPLFVDEAFYWQEGQHFAAAYSDLPGLTAWMTRLGTEIGGQHVLALRAPFLLLAALLPWLITHIASRWFGEAVGWRAGSLVVLMPLAGSLGILALPDVPMAFATVLCLDAGARLLREIDAASAFELALGLTIGALSHYRFIGVIGVGMVALVLLPQGRRVLRDPRVWVALALGIAAWAPLVAWNLENADAGLRFQLVDRHPWAFQSTGWWFLVVQAGLVTPLLFFALIQVFVRSFRADEGMPAQWRYFGLLGGVSTLGFFLLGFFADVERVSFHWPLPGYLPLLIAVPALLREWPRGLRIATWVLSGAGLLAMLGYYLVLSTPQWRAEQADNKFYPANFAGWQELAKAVREQKAGLPQNTVILADNFKIGAELGFALDNPDIAVLDHPLNQKHGRAPQLRLWGLQSDGSRDAPVLLVVSATDVKFRALLAHYQDICRRVGSLPPPQVVNVDHGAQRFLLFALPARKQTGACVAPAIAYLNQPLADTQVPAVFEVSGWAIKDHVGIESVTVTLDGRPIAQATYGETNNWVAEFYRFRSTDPNHPKIGFKATANVKNVKPGRHWLGLILHGKDGSREVWAERPIVVGGNADK